MAISSGASDRLSTAVSSNRKRKESSDKGPGVRHSEPFISFWRCCVESKRARIEAMKTATPQFLIPVLIVCLASVQNAQAVSPPPDGGYPGGNTAEGMNALFSLTTGISNTALGNQALYHNTTGESNTAIGSQALFNKFAFNNTAVGWQALYYNAGGDVNTAIGAHALYRNTSGLANTATGADALYSNTTGQNNTADGGVALRQNTVGDSNTAVGNAALQFNVGGDANTAIGAGALQRANATGNTAIGASALFYNTAGTYNTAIGSSALSGTGGSHNIGIGDSAGHNVGTGSYNIEIGNAGDTVPSETHTIRIGTQGRQTRTFIAGISGVPVTGNAVVVTASGQLGVTASSRRFKDKIQSMGDASETILALKPVTFQYTEDIDPNGMAQFGLVAEDVEKIDPKLVVHDQDGKPFTVRYDAVNAMLLNEFLKERKTVQEQGATIARLQKQVENLTAGLQKVSTQLELHKPAPQMVLNNQ
jgi:trimeric autotransporter adhesin